MGFRSISSEYYAAAVRKLQPDIVVGLADIPFGQESVGLKRKDKMSDRTETWTRDIIAKRNTLDSGDPKFSIFAPILPIERDLQSWYLDHLVDDMLDKIQGIAIYDAYLMEDLPDELHPFPRLSFHNPSSPHDLLRQINLGIDLFTIPFINTATDSGIALKFTFPSPLKGFDPSSTRQSLGIDMWHASLATDVTPLSEHCPCDACTKHHKAYIQHLLSAKEMLGWVLIQMHNHAVLSSFFAAIRASISAGTFEEDIKVFEAYYEPQLPEKTGQGPRLRGYQFKSESHAEKGKKNPKAFRRLGEEEVRALQEEAAAKRKEMKDVVDEDAVVGLVGMDGVDGETVGQGVPSESVELVEVADHTPGKI